MVIFGRSRFFKYIKSDGFRHIRDFPIFGKKGSKTRDTIMDPLKSPILQLFQKSPRPKNRKNSTFFVFEFAPFFGKNDLDLHSVFFTFETFEIFDREKTRRLLRCIFSRFCRFWRFWPKRAKNDLFFTFFWGKKHVLYGFPPSGMAFLPFKCVVKKYKKWVLKKWTKVVKTCFI